MSYILDALRKSDQLRQRGATPTLMTAQATVAAPRQSRLFLNGALVAVLVCAGVLIGWLQPWRSDQPVPAPAATGTKPITPGPLVAARAPLPVMPDMAGGPEQQPLMPKSPSGVVPAPANTEPPLAQPHAVTVVPKEQAATPLPVKAASNGSADSGLKKNVMALTEVPPSVQQEIPAISIAFHAYSSNPKDRRVMINGDMLGQGESLAPGLSLEEITPDGVILAYKGYRFHRGVQ